MSALFVGEASLYPKRRGESAYAGQRAAEGRAVPHGVEDSGADHEAGGGAEGAGRQPTGPCRPLGHPSVVGCG